MIVGGASGTSGAHGLSQVRGSHRYGGAVTDSCVSLRKGTFKALQLVVLVSSVALAACGGGGGDDPAANGNPPGNTGNRAPTISGTPAAQVMQNSAYSFTPTAADADNNTLTFSVTNLPAWAAFNTSTGALTGTPTPSNVGNYQNIVISVSDGTATVSLSSFSINVVATASGAATLSWTPPTQNTDGTSLNDLAGYKVYWGTSQGNYTSSQTVSGAGTTSYMVQQLVPGKYYFVVTAFDADNNESGYSNVATKTVM